MASRSTSGSKTPLICTWGRFPSPFPASAATWRVKTLQRNVRLFLGGLKARGFNTLNSETPIVPIICGEDERAFQMTKLCQEENIFVLPVVSPAVPVGLARLRANVTAAHSEGDIAYALDVFERAGRAVGVI